MLNYSTYVFCSVLQRAVADLDLQMREGVVIQTLREGDRSQKIFFQPFGPQFGLNIRGGPGSLPWIHHWRERVEHRRGRGIPFKVLYWSFARVLKKTGCKGNTM